MEPVRNLEVVQFRLRTQVVIRASIVNKSKEHTQGAPLSPSTLSMYSSPPHKGLSGSSPTRSNSLPLGLGTGTEKPQTCGVSLSKAAPSQRTQPSSVSQFRHSHPVSLLRFQIVLVHSRDRATYCTVLRLAHNLRILRLRKFLGCVEQL